MKKVTRSKRQKPLEFHVVYSRVAAKIGLPWIIQSEKQKWGASHVEFSGAAVRTFEGPFSKETPRFSIVAYGTLTMKGTEAKIRCKSRNKL